MEKGVRDDTGRLEAGGAGGVVVCVDCDWRMVGEVEVIEELYQEAERVATERNALVLEQVLAGRCLDCCYLEYRAEFHRLLGVYVLARIEAKRNYMKQRQLEAVWDKRRALEPYWPCAECMVKYNPLNRKPRRANGTH